jgi:hypothetical protein
MVVGAAVEVSAVVGAADEVDALVPVPLVGAGVFDVVVVARDDMVVAREVVDGFGVELLIVDAGVELFVVEVADVPTEGVLVDGAVGGFDADDEVADDLVGLEVEDFGSAGSVLRTVGEEVCRDEAVGAAACCLLMIVVWKIVI